MIVQCVCEKEKYSAKLFRRDFERKIVVQVAIDDDAFYDGFPEFKVKDVIIVLEESEVE
ncbi:MAG: hypothetical protein IKO36_10120 [Bacteroidaceae bacterium]|nr:hypothetical protein [Bacteroidaceae bacterium]